jgi:hypothetical protein
MELPIRNPRIIPRQSQSIEHGAEYRGTAADYTRIGVADKPIPEARPFTLVKKLRSLFSLFKSITHLPKTPGSIS